MMKVYMCAAHTMRSSQELPHVGTALSLCGLSWASPALCGTTVEYAQHRNCRVTARMCAAAD